MKEVCGILEGNKLLLDDDFRSRLILLFKFIQIVYGIRYDETYDGLESLLPPTQEGLEVKEESHVEVSAGVYEERK